MSEANAQPAEPPSGAFAPLRIQQFRDIWIASLFSNFGQLMLGVAAAWEMTRLTASASMVALVQTAMMLPLMLVAVPAGAVADTFDRRKVAIAGLAFASVSGGVLTLLAFNELTTPTLLLAFCFLIGIGVALYGPSWQASIGEQVSPALLPAAVALGTVSYNVARSIGPAIGGMILLAVGARWAFAITAVFFAPLLIRFVLWRRPYTPPRLPPENVVRAVVSGARFSWHSAGIRTILIRVFLFGLLSASAAALAPLIAKDLLRSGAGVFGLLLGATGTGAIVGALFVSKVRDTFVAEHVVRFTAVVSGAALALTAVSHWVWLTMLAMFVIGATNILSTALLNVSVQLSAPRWVTARALSLYAASMTGGVALGAWVWGSVAGKYDVSVALLASGALGALSALLGLVLPTPNVRAETVDAAPLPGEPDVALAITMRSGPVVVEINYSVDPEQAREFYGVMQHMQALRRRNGGFNWSLSRDIADPSAWVERYECPTWGDYLRVRDRWTEADRELQRRADAFHRAQDRVRVRRLLHRPFGSVRWQDESPDPKQEAASVLLP